MSPHNHSWIARWQHLLSAAERRVERWMDGLVQSLRELIRVLSQPDFWLSLIWVLLAGGVFFGLAWFAVSQYDTFLRLQPKLCTKTLNNTRLLVIVMLAPLSLVFTLVASSEFLALRKRLAEKRRAQTKGAGSGWRGAGYFWVYTGLMVLSWAILFWAMRC